MKYALILLLFACSAAHAAGDTTCPKGSVLMATAPFTAEQKDAIARLKQHNADIAVAHAKKQQPDASLRPAIDRLVRYKDDVKLVCAREPS